MVHADGVAHDSSLGRIAPTLLSACRLALPTSWAYDSPPMNEHATHAETTLTTDLSPVVFVRQRFFLCTADNERLVT